MKRIASTPNLDDGPAPKKNQGMAHPRAKLTDADIRAIRQSHLSAGSLAQAFGISRSHVTNIRAGRRWPHVGKQQETETQPRPEEDADGSR